MSSDLTLEGALRVSKDLDVSSLSKEELQEVYAWLHLAWHIEKRTGSFIEHGESWSKEDIWNLYQLLLEAMAKEGIRPQNIDDLDTTKLSADYGQPAQHNENGEMLFLDDVLQYIKPVKLAHPFVYLTGGIVNHGSTTGDIDILIKASENDPVARVTAFRVFRLFPPELQDRIHFLYDNPEFTQSGPVTSHVPALTLECQPILPLERVEQSHKLHLYLVGAQEPLLDYCDGVMLNAYNLSTKQIQNAKAWKASGIRVMLDNGAFSDKTLTPSQLLEASKLVEADVVCAPDFLYDIDSDKKSIKAQREFLNMKPECKVMGIGQGQSAFKFEACIREIIKLNPDIIGIGRKSIQVAGYPSRGLPQRVFAMQRLQELGILDEIKDQGIEIHALGVENPHVFKYLNLYGFNSVDSMSYIWSSIYGQLYLPEDPDEKPIKLKEGQVIPKETDTPELIKKKQALVDAFKSLSSLEEKQAFILKEIWLPLREKTATEEDVRRITEGLSIEQRDDSPTLQKLSEAI